MKLLVANKVDRAEREVDREEAEAWARSKGMLFIETSAKTSVGISQVFNEVVQKILENTALLDSTRPSHVRTVRGLPRKNNGGSSSGSCCSYA